MINTLQFCYINQCDIFAAQKVRTLAEKGRKADIKKKSKSSLPEMFCKKTALKSFLTFTGKNLSRSLFFNIIDNAFFNIITPGVYLKAIHT